MKIFTTAFALLLFAAQPFAQTVNYDDVAVIINDNSQTSQNIADYFRIARNVPDVNMIHISCSTNEEIDSLEFESIRQQIETYITTNNLTTSLNYLVTTKGVPLKVDRDECDSNVGASNCSSFDSDIALILGTYSNEIAQVGSFTNPYLGSSNHFSSSFLPSDFTYTVMNI